MRNIIERLMFICFILLFFIFSSCKLIPELTKTISEIANLKSNTINISFKAIPKLNLCGPNDHRPKTLFICIYQLKEIHRFEELTYGEESFAGIDFILNCDKTEFYNDDSVIETKRLLIDPDSSISINMEIQSDAKYLYIVGNFCIMEKSKIIQIIEKPFDDLKFLLKSYEIKKL